jgi:hypothetical protein
MGSANGRRAAGEQYLGGVTWAPPAECLHEGPWVGMNLESKIEVGPGKTERPGWLLAQTVRREG